jgi:transketolase
MDKNLYQQMANCLRFLSIDAVEKAQSGHPGMPMGMADVATVLFKDFLKFDPQNETWENRDRFVLSAGHGSMLLYSLLHLTGFKKFTLDELKNFRQKNSHTPGHPEHGFGIETTTGPLGQGLGNAVGMALAERILNARLGDDLINHHTYVMASDGDLMEGISHESISLAGHLKLNKLIVLFDDNGISIDGPTSLSVSDDQVARFKACGWNAVSIDGHNYDEIYNAISYAQKSDKPTLIACKTTIGYGSPKKAGTSAAHGSPLGTDEVLSTRQSLNWSHAPFDIPAHLQTLWNDVGIQGNNHYQTWKSKADQSINKELFNSYFNEDHTQKLNETIRTVIHEFIKNPVKQGSRLTSQTVIEHLSQSIPNLIGGSADLTGSNNTKGSAQHGIQAPDYDGSYVYYGVREHGMAACMNGMILHGGLKPYGGTFLIFSDYLRPSLRLSALMNQPVIYVLTHDSIGLGEDGPTHQPIEHIESLRLIPNVMIFRPCDGVEVAESWECALMSQSSPSVMVLSRQALPQLRLNVENENKVSKGAYIISATSNDMDEQFVLITSGSEVSLAMDIHHQLKSHNIGSRVVSMPCLELFKKQDLLYQQSIIPTELKTVLIEAALHPTYPFPIHFEFGMKSFGASAPYLELYDMFGLTAPHIIKKIMA